jgi:hypothetical protein
MMRLLVCLFILAPIVGSAKAATEKTALTGDPVAAVNLDLAMVTKGASPKTAAVKAFATDPDFTAMKKMLSARKLELLPRGQSLCLSDRTATLCWRPVTSGRKTGVQFEGSQQTFFYNASWTQTRFHDELKKFLQRNRGKGAVSLLKLFDLLIPSAQADDSSPVGKLSEPVDVRTLPFDTETNPWTQYRSYMPYDMVYWNGKAWAKLAADPAQNEIDAFAKGAREELAGWLQGEKSDTYSCGNQEFSWNRKSDGKRVTLTRLKEQPGQFRFSVTNDSGKQVPVAVLGLHVGPETVHGQFMGTEPERALDKGCAQDAKAGLIHSFNPLVSCPSEPRGNRNKFDQEQGGDQNAQNMYYKRAPEADSLGFCAWSRMICSYPAPLRPTVVRPCVDAACGDADLDREAPYHHEDNINGQGDIYEAVVGGAAAKNDSDNVKKGEALYEELNKRISVANQLRGKINDETSDKSATGDQLSQDEKALADADKAVQAARAAHKAFYESAEWTGAMNDLNQNFLQSLGKMQEKMIVYSEVEKCCESGSCIKALWDQSQVRLVAAPDASKLQDVPSVNLSPTSEDAR